MKQEKGGLTTVLKEAFHAQNVFDKWLSTMEATFSLRDRFTKTVEKHFKSKAYPEAEDEIVEEPNELGTLFTKEDGTGLSSLEMLYFAEIILAYKETLSNAISTAKKNLPIDIDVAINMANRKRKLGEVLAGLNSLKTTKTKTEGIGYKMDNEGKQTTYRYPIEKVKSIYFDRNKFRAEQRKLMKEASEISAKVDYLMVTTEVPFECPFDFEGSINDAVETYFATVTGAAE